MVRTFVVRQKVDLRRTFYFDTRIAPEVRVCEPVFNLRMLSYTVRYGWSEKRPIRVGVLSNKVNNIIELVAETFDKNYKIKSNVEEEVTFLFKG